MRRLTSSEIAVAASLLRQGCLVAVPTETVYGLAANGLDPLAVARIYTAKGRPADNPLILHVPDLEAAWPLWSLNEGLRARASRAAALWPGPLTLVLPASTLVPAIVTAGLSTVAVRVPKHPVTLAILAEVGFPLAAPSANRSGLPSPTLAEHVAHQLSGHIDAVIDGGACDVGVESTVVDLSSENVRILRPGAVSPQALEEALGEPVVRYDAAFVGASPGLRHRHYRPNVDVVVPLLHPQSAWKSADALIVFASTAGKLASEFGARDAHTEVLPDSADGAMRALYAALVRVGASGAGRVQIELPSVDRHVDSAWDAVRDRLGRATT